MRSYWWVLIQHDWCPFKRLGYRPAEREDQMKAREVSYLQAKEMGLIMKSMQLSP